MAIEKKLIHFKKWSDFSSKKLSANEQNTQYTLGVDGALTTGAPDILYQSICWIKDVKKMWTHGTLYDCSGGGGVDLSQYVTDEELSNAISEFLTADDLAKVATSGSYNDLVDKPTIPSAVTESTVSGWGFTKNTGTITGISVNGTSVATSGVADMPAASTSKYGVTRLSSATNSSSTTLAATASAVKSAYDLAASKASMSDVNTAIANAITNAINASY